MGSLNELMSLGVVILKVIKFFYSFRLLVSGCIQFTLFGAGIVYLLLASQLIRELLRHLAPGIGLCHWFIIIAVVLCPAMWLGSPKDFW